MSGTGDQPDVFAAMVLSGRIKHREAVISCLSADLTAASAEIASLREKLAKATELLDCARDEFEAVVGRIADDTDPHWSVAARTFLATLTKESTDAAE